LIFANTAGIYGDIIKFIIFELGMPAGKSKHKRTGIPIHKLQERTAQGIQLRHFLKYEMEEMRHMGAHRDDYYVFILQEYGSTDLMIDFKKISVNGNAALFILPGQVHHIVSCKQTSGWFMAIDSALVEKRYRKIFQEQVRHQQSLQLNQLKTDQIKKCIELLTGMFDESGQMVVPEPVIHSLASAYMGMFANLYSCESMKVNSRNLRPEVITREFRKLVGEQFKIYKNPGYYASSLSLSLSYLNEVVKAVTGSNLSYWIHQEIVLEAKRLLYYSDLSVKQIAFSLGYDDHAYFSRLFTKVSGVSAVKFRKEYRK